MTAVPCDKLHAFADGELAPEEVAAFERHFVDCPGCQAELQDVLVLEALGQGLSGPVALPVLDQVPAPAPVRVSGGVRRARSVLWLAAFTALVGGVVLASMLAERHTRPSPAASAPRSP